MTTIVIRRIIILVERQMWLSTIITKLFIR
nr:MAG TPA: hypothetical protein [Caudoviricetes sp.]